MLGGSGGGWERVGCWDYRNSWNYFQFFIFGFWNGKEISYFFVFLIRAGDEGERGALRQLLELLVLSGGEGSVLWLVLSGKKVSNYVVVSIGQINNVGELTLISVYI